MADSSIGNLDQISSELVNTDLLVLERNGTAMSVSGEQLSEFMDRTVLSVTISQLADTADITYAYDSSTGALTIGLPVGMGVGSISDPTTSGLTDTYTVYLDDGSELGTFTVTNGSNIASIARTSGDGSAGTTDTYTVALTDGTATQFYVYNGADGQGTVNTVDSVSVDSGTTNVTLDALSYGRTQSLSSTEKLKAWSNMTGVGSYPQLKTNLESTSSASVMQASPSIGVTGTLPITNGGTGGTTAADARSSLGLGFVIGETGTFSITAQTSVATTDTDITFTKTYTDSDSNAVTPYVMVIGTNASACVYGLPTVKESSSTDATIRCRNSSTHSGTAMFQWFTIVDASVTIS